VRYYLKTKEEGKEGREGGKEEEEKEGRKEGRKERKKEGRTKGPKFQGNLPIFLLRHGSLCRNVTEQKVMF
jgi:predicted transposase YdaD